jgi:hypothetical protein
MIDTSAEPLDEELFAVLEETCKSYQSFLRSLGKQLATKRAEGSLESWIGPGVVGYWLTYLLLLSYDVGFITLAILREGIDRQLLTMKRQAFEYAVRALYLVKFPEKAQQQYDALPLKMRQYIEKLDAKEAYESFAEVMQAAEEAASRLPSGAGPTYGEVSLYDMLVAIYPDDYKTAYMREFWWPSAIMHGHQIGMLDALARYGDGKIWLSHNSMTSTRTGNTAVITQSLLHVLLLTGDRFELRGTHWVSLVDNLNAVIRRLNPESKTLDLPLDSDALRKAAAHKPATQDIGR